MERLCEMAMIRRSQEKDKVMRIDVENFQPIPVVSPVEHPVAFRLRCIVDLQLATIVQHLRPAIADLHGQVLDVGAGQSPWRAWLPTDAHYQGIDVGHAVDFGMATDRGDVIYYDGLTMPLADACFDAVLCIEVLEHAEDPLLLLAEIFRVMRGGATLVLTAPWSARRHHIPHDYHRFTRERLQRLLQCAGFFNIDIRERGNDIGAIANKLTILTLRLARPRLLWHIILTWPLAMICGLQAILFIALAHLSMAFNFGSWDDPLGYFVRAQKDTSTNASH
jgi:SAM-dependent methyltransferase